jgi:hypothetical protein
MANATDHQVQVFVDERIRPRCEAARNLAAAMLDDIAEISSVYAALTQQSPTWTDSRSDGPPNLALPSDVLAINSFIHDISTAITTNAQWAIVQKLCIRPVTG